MQAFCLSTRSAPIATVWAESAEHALYLARALRLAHGNTRLWANQINGRAPKHTVSMGADEARFARRPQPALAGPPKGFAIQADGFQGRLHPLSGRLLIDGRPTVLRISQRAPGGSVEVYETYGTASAGMDATGREGSVQVNYYALPRRRYTLHTWPALPSTGSYVDFEHDVRALILDLEG